MGKLGKIWLVFACLVISHALFAQEEKADKYLNLYRFSKAIPLYEKALKQEETPQLLGKIGHCYRMMGQYKKAETYYAKAVAYESVSPEVVKAFGEVLAINKKYEEAKDFLVVFATDRPQSKYASISAQKLNEVILWKDIPGAFEVTAFPEINTNFSDFCAVAHPDGIVFVSERDEDFINENNFGFNYQPYSSVYILKAKDSLRYKKPKLFDPAFNSDFHDGPICFADSGQLAVFTRIVQEGRKAESRPKLFFSRFETGKWTKPEPFRYNHWPNAFAHPALTPDGNTLVFVSDFDWGKGGKDLFITTQSDTGWTKPKIFSSLVNSDGDELFPSFQNDSVLYFSSNGYGGLGGLDIFRTQFENGEWTVPVNMRSPLNSDRDDFALSFQNDSLGFFSSNRDGGKGKDDIFRIRLLPVPMEELITMNGVFLYSELRPAYNSRISLMDENNTELSFTYTNEKGEFEFNNLPPKKQYYFMYDLSDPNLGKGTRIYLVDKDGERTELEIDPYGSFVYNQLQMDNVGIMTLMEEDDPGLFGVSVYGQFYREIPGDMDAPMEVIFFNRESGMMTTSNTIENGKFNFRNLSPDEEFVFKLKQDYGDVKLMFIDAEGRFVSNAEKVNNLTFKYIMRDPLSDMVVMNKPVQISVEGQLFSEQPGDLEPGTKVDLVNEKGQVVASAYIDENGNFKFEHLPPDEHFMLKVDAEDTGAMKMVFLDETGGIKNVINTVDTLIAIDESISHKTSKPQGISLEGKILAQNPNDLKPGTKVDLIDEKGKVVASAYIDENGNFKFENLPPDEHFMLQIDAEDDSELKLAFLDETGDISEVVEATDAPIAVEPSMTQGEETIEKELIGKVYADQPGDIPEGTTVYLVNEKGEVISSAYVDENGNFKFEKLPPDENFMLRVDATDDSELKMVFLDNAGEIKEVAEIKDGGFLANQQSLEPITTTLETIDLSGQLFQTLPGDVPEGTPVHILNEKGEIIYTTFIDENGNFKFKNLPPDEFYMVEVGAEDTEMKIVLLDDEGTIKQVAQKTDEGFKITNIPANDIDVAALFGQVYQNLPGDLPPGTKVNIVDEAGNVLYSALIDEKGNFKFEKLPHEDNYLLQMAEADTQFRMIFKDEFGNSLGVAEWTESGFVVSNEMIAQPNQHKLDIQGQAYHFLPGDIPAGFIVNLVDDQGSLIYSALTNENGFFKFSNLSPDEFYLIQTEASNTEIQIAFLDKEGRFFAKAEKIPQGFLLPGSTPAVTEPQPFNLAGQVLHTLPFENLAGMQVNLVDDQGNIIYTTAIDQKGNFKFENLPPDVNYLLMIDSDDPEMKIVFFDEEGKVKNETTLDADGMVDVEEPLPPEPLSAVDVKGKVMKSLKGKLIPQIHGESVSMMVHIMDSEGQIIFTTTADSNGFFEFTNLPPAENYMLRVLPDDPNMVVAFLDQSGKETVRQKPDNTGLFELEPRVFIKRVESISLKPLPVPPAGKPETISFSGQLLSNLPNDSMDGIKLYLVNRQSEILQEFEVNDDLSFNIQNVPYSEFMIFWVNRNDINMEMKVTEDVSNEVMFQLVPNYFIYVPPEFQDKRLAIRNRRGESIPIVENQNYAIRNIYYEFDSEKQVISDNFTLDELVKLMQENPNLKLELSGHTDRWGTATYNKTLSQKRAESAANYLIERGISKERITAIGYGESKLVNHCSDGVYCTPQQHAQNRRTEFKVFR